MSVIDDKSTRKISVGVVDTHLYFSKHPKNNKAPQ